MSLDSLLRLFNTTTSSFHLKEPTQKNKHYDNGHHPLPCWEQLCSTWRLGLHEAHPRHPCTGLLPAIFQPGDIYSTLATLGSLLLWSMDSKDTHWASGPSACPADASAHGEIWSKSKWMDAWNPATILGCYLNINNPQQSRLDRCLTTGDSQVALGHPPSGLSIYSTSCYRLQKLGDEHRKGRMS